MLDELNAWQQRMKPSKACATGCIGMAFAVLLPHAYHDICNGVNMDKVRKDMLQD